MEKKYAAAFCRLICKRFAKTPVVKLCCLVVLLLFVRVHIIAQTNLATSGTAYYWYQLTSTTTASTNNTAASPATKLNDGDTSTSYNIGTNNNASAQYQAVGIYWTTSQSNITSIKFYNGSAGYFNSSSVTVQYTTATNMGTATWTNASGTWNVYPSAYPGSSTANGQSYTFSSTTAISGIRAIRIIGGVSNGSSLSFREIQVGYAVTSVAVSPTTATVNVGATQQLTATNTSSIGTTGTALNPNVTWSSSNTAVATVSSTGLVTGVSAGTATITVTTVDGNKTATSAITVSVPVTGVSVSPTTASIAVGGTQQLTATIAPSNATNQTVTWSSSNTAVALVSSTGIVTAIATGSANITVTTADGSKTATAAITVTAATTGFIYIHNKSINEANAVATTFTLTNSSGTTIKTFTLNDNPNNTIDVYDLGAGHGLGSSTTNGGNSELWVIGSTTSGVGTGTSQNGTSGNIYRRTGTSTSNTSSSTGNTSWAQVSASSGSLTGNITATAIDGAYYNQFVFINGGNVYFYYAGTTTQIYSGGNATDVAAGGGNIAIVANGGRIYTYPNAYTAASAPATGGTWFNLVTAANSASRLDMNSTGTSIAFTYNNAVRTIAFSTTTAGTGTSLNFATYSTGTAGIQDIAYDDNGVIYATGATTTNGNSDIVYSYSGTTWTAEPEARGIKRLTGGAGGQAWGAVNLGSFPETIWTRAIDNLGDHVWLDDERVTTSQNVNSIMIEVPAGTYTVTETLPSSSWDVGRFNVYDPTGNSTGNVSTNSVSFNVSASESVNAEFISELLNPKAITLTCTTQTLESFDAGTGSGQYGTGAFGTAVDGTAYHYYNAANGGAQDGYYQVVKSLVSGTNWFSSSITADHTGTTTGTYGYFLVVNASYAKDEFYRRRVTNLVPGLYYTITFWVANAQTNPIYPNVTYGLQDLSGNIVNSSTTGNITAVGVWTQESFTFKATTATADLFLRNNNIGGLGNDIALDDISLNPVITPLGDNTISPTINPNICIGTDYTFSNAQSGGQWSTSNINVATVFQPGTSSDAIVNGIAAGSAIITYKYTNNIGCVSLKTSSVVVSAPPVVIVTDQYGGAICMNQKDSLYTTMTTTSTAPYTYSWTAVPSSGSGLSTANIANTATINPTGGTSYTYTDSVTDALGCAAAASVTVAVSAHNAPAVTVTGTNVCLGSAITDLKANITTGSTGSYTYLWTAVPSATSGLITSGGSENDNIQSPSPTPTAATTYAYSVKVNDGFCNVYASNNVTVYPGITVTATSNPSGTFTLCNGGSIALTATPSGGTAPYTYTWSASGTGNGLGSSTTATNTATPTASGTYTYSVIAKDTHNCVSASSSVTDNVTVSSLIGSPTLSITSPSAAISLCSGTSTTLTAKVTNENVLNSYTYAWSPTTTVPSTGTFGYALTGHTFNSSASPTASGAYTFTVTTTVIATGISCVTSVPTPVITVNQSPTVTASSNASTTCSNSLTDILSATGTGANTLNYTWVTTSTPSGGAATIASPTSATTNVTLNSVTGNYIFTVTTKDAVNNCTATSAITIVNSANTGPTITGMNAAASFCLGSSISFNPTVTKGSSTGTTNSQISISSSNGSSKTSCVSYGNAFDGNTGTYFYASTNTGYVYGNFSTAQKITQISFYPIPGQESAMVGGKFYGSTSNSGVSGATLLYTITSTPSSGLNTVTSGNTTTSFSYIYYQNANGVTYTSCASTGTYYSLIADIAVYTATTSTTPVNISSYLWTSAPSTGSGLITSGGSENDNIQSPTVTPTAASAYVYSLKVTDAAGCVATASTGTQTVNALPTITASAANGAFCGTFAGGFISGSDALFSTASGGSGTYSSYSWTGALITGSGSTTITNSTSQNATANITGATSGATYKYTVQVTDGNGCKGTGTTSALIAASSPAAAAAASLASTACTGKNINLTGTVSYTSGASAAPPYTYTWSPPTTSVVTPASTVGVASTTNTATATTTSAGSYTYGLLIVDNNNCSASAQTNTVAVNASPAPVIQPVCSGTLGQPGWYTYLMDSYDNPSSLTGYAWSSNNSHVYYYTDATYNEVTKNQTSTLAQPYITVQNANVATFFLTVTNTNGCSASASYTPATSSDPCSVILPVTLVDFTAEKKDATVLLTWVTATEINNKYFDIERSTDGVNWVAIGQVKGNGTTTTQQEYTFTDNAPVNGYNYYRLKQVDFSGQYSYSAVKKIQFTGEWIVKLYPNPAVDYIMLDFVNSKNETANIVISDVLGNKVLSLSHQLVQGRNTIMLKEVQLLPGGTYLITLVTPENVFKAKFIKGSK
jgi:uncharacterized protein YjdB